MPDPIIGNNILNSDSHLFEKGLKNAPNKEPFVSQPLSQIPLSRYNKVFYGANNEELYARSQSGLDQLANGILKATGSFASSFATGTIGVLNGLREMMAQQRAAAFFDNDFNRKFDDFNKYLEDALPNYYTQAEKDAEWYSPTNIFSANFIGDKVLKNLGYSFGALAGGMGWGAALRGIGLTGRLVRAGKGLQAVEAAEAAMVNAPKLEQLGAINKSLNSLWSATKTTAGKALTNTDRAIISAMGTFGEASIEAMDATNNFRNKLIEDYKTTYGAAPTGTALEEINSYADKVGTNIFAANAALLTFTNYVQLPKILGSSKSFEKAAINNIKREAAEEVVDATGKKILKQTEKYAADIPDTGNILSPIVNKLGKPGRFVDKYILGPGRLTFSAGEAFEEGAQFSIQTGVEDYFDRAYKHKEDAEQLLGGIGDVLGNIFSEGVSKTLNSKEGLESILIGGLSGGLQKIRENIKERGFFGTGGEVAANTQLAIQALNKTNFEQVLKDGKKYTGIAIGSQQLRQQAIENNDTFNEKNYEQDYALAYIMPRVKYGKEEAINQEIERYKEQASSDGGFEQLQAAQIALPGETREKFIQRLENIKKTSEEVKKAYETVNNKYSGLTDKEGRILYTPETVDKMVYAISKVADFDKRLKELESDLIFNGLSEEALSIKETIKTNENFKAGKIEEAIKESKLSETFLETKKKIEDVEEIEGDDVMSAFEDFTEMLIQRQSYINDYMDLKNNPSKYRESVKTSESTKVDDSEKPSVVKIKTKSGEFEYVIGEEYFLGTAIKGVNEKGFEEISFPSLTILADNGDGTIQIKDGSGKIKNIEKSKLEQYKLGKLSSLTSDKKGKFFYDNRNVLFEFNFGKGKKVKGRLEYSQKTGILLFKYFDKNGKVKYIEVTGDQFVAQKGYSQAMIVPIGTITAIQQKSLEEYAAEKDARTINKREARLNILNEMFDQTSEKLEKTKNLINRKYSEFEKITNDLIVVENKIKAGELTKRQNFKKTTGKAIQVANRLSRMQEELRKEIQELEAEQEELEFLQSYIADMAQNIDELPTDSKEFIEELREQVNDLESLQLSTGMQINSISKLIDQTENALDQAINFIKELIGEFEKKYPNTPTSIVTQEWIDFLKNNPNFLKLKPNFKSDLSDLEDLIAQVEDLDIVPGERTVNELRVSLEKLLDNLNDIQKELFAKEKILNKFESVANEYKKTIEENKKLAEDEAFIESILKTADNSQRTLDEKEPFEEDSKKRNVDIPRATIPSFNLPGYIVSQIFGNTLSAVRKVKEGKIKAVIVTRKNQKEIFGTDDINLIEHLGQGNISEEEMDSTIAIVMVEMLPDGSRRFVGANGEVLENPSVENMVYQVMPTEKLQWSEKFDNKTMFREGTPVEVVNELKKQYKAWREGILSDPPTGTFSIQVSFGNPEYSPKLNENGDIEVGENGKPKSDPDAKVSVVNSGLINERDLKNKNVLRIPTTNDVESAGTTFFKKVRGRVFLVLENGLVKLRNRKFNKKEATVIYQAIRRVSEIAFSEDGDLKSEEAQQILNWLKSTVYWGTPRNAEGKRTEGGHNSIFFERASVTDDEGIVRKKLMLFFSNKGGAIPFSPSYIKENESSIIALIQELYNNVNSTLANGTKNGQEWDRPYDEIIEIKPNGTIVTRQWDNYQSYLLSNKYPDGSSRASEELPLYTSIRPKKDENDVNRQGVYFILTDLQYKEPKVASSTAPRKIVPKAAPTETSTETATSGKPKRQESKEGEIDLTGKKINSFVEKAENSLIYNKVIKWIFDPSKSGLDAITISSTMGDVQAAIVDLVNYFRSTKPINENESDEDYEKRIRDLAKLTLQTKIQRSIPEELLAQAAQESEVIVVDPEENEAVDEAVEDSKDEYDEEEIQSPEEDDDVDGDDNLTFDSEDVSIEEEEEELTSSEKVKRKLRNLRKGGGSARSDLRMKIDEKLKMFKPENWKEVEQWLKQNFPNLPVYRVKNIITNGNGLQAWGMLKDGALYVYENAEVGTIYHEVFEGVWKMFSSPKERKQIIKEFRSRKGSFIDRPTGRTIEYKNATPFEIKEQLAEEFRDYVQFKKIPPKPENTKPLILRLFADIVTAIKNFFANTPTAQNNTERLFQKIGTGYYKRAIPIESKLAFANRGIIDIESATFGEEDELRLALKGEVIHDVMQEMTYLTLLSVVSNNEDLFNLDSKFNTTSNLYKNLKYELSKTILSEAALAREMVASKELTKEEGAEIISSGITMLKIIRKQWPEIVKKHKEYLSVYNIEFDENDDVNLKSEENTGRGEYDSSDKIDHFRKTNSAIKLLLSTLPMMEDGSEILSSINGVKLLPLSKVFVTLMNELHSSRNPDEMLSRLRNLANNDENYRKLYKRITGVSYLDNTFDYSNLSDKHQLNLISAIWNTFKKQSPDAKTVFIFDSGEVSVGDSNLATAARQIKSEFEDAMVKAIKNSNKYFEYSDKEKGYVGKADSIKAVELNSTIREVEFLSNFGINFTAKEIEKLDDQKVTTFKKAVSGIRDSIKSAKKLTTISGKILNLEGRLLELALIRASLDNPEFDSTFFNVKGERTQSFMGTNAISSLYDTLSQIENLNDLSGTQYEYLMGALKQEGVGDVFTQGSYILSKMFDLETGERRKTATLLKPGYIDGTINDQNGKRRSSANLTYGERLVQEINANLQGVYGNLIPADASLEHTFYMGTPINQSQLLKGFEDVFKIFRGYLESEVALSRDNRPVKTEKGKREITDLRFFKDILPQDLHDKIVKDKKTPIEEIYEKYNKNGQIDKAVEAFIKKDAENTKAELFEYGILKYNEEGEISVKNIKFNNSNLLTEPDLNRNLNALSVNYMIANIELHKLLYSDPYQYEDELKRIKNFLSPRLPIVSGSLKINRAYNRVYNEGYSNEDIARTNFQRDYFRTISYNDIIGTHALMGYVSAFYKETDGSGIISYKSYRNFRIRAGNWNAAEEKQYQYDMAWEKQYKVNKIKESGRELTKEEQKKFNLSEKELTLLKEGNPSVKSAYTSLKPIVSGNKADGNNYNDVILDKYALYPLSFRVMVETSPDSNIINLYNKMQKEDVDYVVFNSGRKVGAKNSVNLYENGEFNNNPYPKNSIVNVPFETMSVQAEIPSKDSSLVTRGSQVTKLVTIDFMQGGVPVDFDELNPDFESKYIKWINLSEQKKLEESELYREIKNNQLLLEAMTEAGYKTLLKRLGIEEVIKRGKVTGYKIVDFSKSATTLREEILKRESNDNVIESLNDFLSGNTILEATPTYQQVRNILYSIADKEAISPKMTGGMKVQIPSTLLEKNRISPIDIKSEDGKTKTAYTSDVLKFYSKTEDGKKVNVCEIMVGRWFDSSKTDEELLDYFNNTEEGKKQISAMFGVGFRIPTQKQNSIDAFVIKKFLPKEFGDNVVVPAQIVNKQGSDFDIDKLSIYLKNVFVNRKGEPIVIKFLTDDNSSVEERYVRWIKDNVPSDLSKYLKFLTKKQVANLKANFEIEKAKVEASFVQIKKERKDELFLEMIAETSLQQRQQVSEQESYLEELFELGKKVFWRMDDSTREPFWQVKRNISENNINGAEEIRRYLNLTISLLEEGNVLEEDVVRLEGLEKIYTEELRVMGVTDEIIDNIRKEALKSFREEKKAINATLKLEKLPELNYLNDLYDDAKLQLDVEAAEEMAEIEGLPSKEDFSKFNIYDQNTKAALQNAYVESLEKLITHPKNFDQLIKPNSADQLKDLAKEITKMRGFNEVDYKATGKMLNRNFMTRLRHAFVSGKYAIGIAAVNQTNHSLNQRQLIFIDKNNLENVPFEDLEWLGDGEIKFEKYNSVKIDGKKVPTLSMITNAEGQYISDLIAQFIDGYVDIAKGPWIMELGASQNVASTWLFLIKLGVPIRSVAYFMNQPIIREYLNMVENAGYSWLFIDDFVNLTLDNYDSKGVESSGKIPSESALEKMIGNKKLTPQQNAQQQLILKEFLKYAKMANHMFLVTQGSNHDTATFNDPLLVFKKNEQTKAARQTIFSGMIDDGDGKLQKAPAVDALISNSFLRKVVERLSSIRDVNSEFLPSDKGKSRNVLEKTLLPYINVNDREFIKIARKAVSDLFDWAVQTNPSTGLNKVIYETLVEDGGDAKEVVEFLEKAKRIPELQGNEIVNSMISELNGDVNNLKLKNRDNKVYDQNKIIYGFEELRNYLKSRNKLSLYKKIVNVSILQSGLSSSKIAFTQLLPYEDFKKEYSAILNKLFKMDNLEDFYNLNVFQRNNWNNDDIVPRERARWIETKEGKRYNPAMEFLNNNLKKKVASGEIPKVLSMSVLSRSSKQDFIVYSWEKNEELLTEKERNLPYKQRSELIKEKKKQMKKDGDFSYIQKGLFKKVKQSSMEGAEDFTFESNDKYYYLYKMVNAWGNSFSANEFYDVAKPSVLENGFLKTKEVEDEAIINAYNGEKGPLGKESASKQTSTQAPVSGPSSAVSQSVKGNIKLNIIEDWVQSGQATTTVRNSSYHNSFYKGDGVYTTDKGNLVNITYRGLVKLQGDKVVGNNISYTKDEFAKAEGFGTWENFKKDAKYAGKTLIDGGSVHLYDIKPAQAPVTADEVSLKSQIDELYNKMKTTGISPAESATLAKLQAELKNIIKSRCKITS